MTLDAFAWHIYRKGQSGLPDDFVSCLATGPDGGVWIGTESAGLVRYRDGEFEVFSPENAAIPSLWIRALASGPDGTVWVGTDDGLAVGNSQEWKRHDGPGHIRSLLVARDGTLWCGTFEEGLFHLVDGAWREHNIANGCLINNRVWTLVEDEDGAIWAGTGHGATRYDGHEWVTLGSDIVSAIACAPRDLWLGTTSGLKRVPRLDPKPA
jgi:ligand-binding sensor domain-containing protein